MRQSYLHSPLDCPAAVFAESVSYCDYLINTYHLTVYLVPLTHHLGKLFLVFYLVEFIFQCGYLINTYHMTV